DESWFGEVEERLEGRGGEAGGGEDRSGKEALEQAKEEKGLDRLCKDNLGMGEIGMEGIE
ncbi:unnamed protein product, partial [marine sediment metagenome]